MILAAFAALTGFALWMVVMATAFADKVLVEQEQMLDQIAQEIADPPREKEAGDAKRTV